MYSDLISLFQPLSQRRPILHDQLTYAERLSLLLLVSNWSPGHSTTLFKPSHLGTGNEETRNESVHKTSLAKKTKPDIIVESL